MSLDYSTTSAMLKEMYPLRTMEELGYWNKPFLAMVTKDSEAGGDQEKIPVDVAPVQAASATFSSAQTQAAAVSSTFRGFEVTTVNHYSLARIQGKMVRATRNDKMAFAKGLEKEVSNAFRTMGKKIETHMFRDGQGWIGRVGTSGISTTTLTLAHATQAHCFEYLQEVVLTSSLSGALRDSGNSATITGINRSGGTLVTDSNWTSQISGATDDDYIIPIGDYVSASDELCIAGAEKWIPATAPTSGDSHFGVDRSIDVERLAGIRYDGSSDTIDDALINGQSEASANGAPPDYCFMSQFNVRRLVKSLFGKVRYETVQLQGKGSDGEPMANVGFQGIRIIGDTGPITVVADPFVPYDVAWMLNLDSWVLYSMGEFPGILMEDGQRIRAVYNADEYEVRVGGYPQLACHNPGANCRIKLA